MPSEFFTTQEDAWLKRVALDFIEWTTHNDSKTTPYFIARAVLAFFKEFPYRHARNVHHEQHYDKDQGLVIYGEEYGKLHEVGFNYPLYASMIQNCDRRNSATS